jgi:hypothetical protein
MGNILNDRYGLLAVTLGVVVMVLIFLILLTLCLAYKSERHLKEYHEMSDA